MYLDWIQPALESNRLSQLVRKSVILFDNGRPFEYEGDSKAGSRALSFNRIQNPRLCEGQLAAEKRFWKNVLQQAWVGSVDFVIIHTENLLSDLIAASLVEDESRVAVIFPNRGVATLPQRLRITFQARKLRHRIAGLCQELSFDHWMLRGKRIMYDALRFVAYRKFELPRTVTARSQAYLTGRLAGTYLVPTSDSSAVRNGTFDQKVKSFRGIVSREDDLDLGPRTPLLLLSGDPSPRIMSDYLESVVHWSRLALELSSSSAIRIRPHPRFGRQGERVAGLLREAGLEAELVGRTSLYEDVLRSSMVLGISSSALQAAADFSQVTVVELTVPSQMVGARPIVAGATNVVRLDDSTKTLDEVSNLRTSKRESNPPKTLEDWLVDLVLPLVGMNPE